MITYVATAFLLCVVVMLLSTNDDRVEYDLDD